MPQVANNARASCGVFEMDKACYLCSAGAPPPPPTADAPVPGAIILDGPTYEFPEDYFDNVPTTAPAPMSSFAPPPSMEPVEGVFDHGIEWAEVALYTHVVTNVLHECRADRQVQQIAAKRRTSGYRIDRHIPNIQDYFLGLS